MKYKLKVYYIGTNYEGWQSQPSGNTIQDILEKALFTFLREKIRLTGCSRTDSGVHAKGLVASFETNAAYDERKWIKSIHALIQEILELVVLRLVKSPFIQL